jgi:hypothetical protein
MAANVSLGIADDDPGIGIADKESVSLLDFVHSLAFMNVLQDAKLRHDDSKIRAHLSYDM